MRWPFDLHVGWEHWLENFSGLRASKFEVRSHVTYKN